MLAKLEDLKLFLNITNTSSDALLFEHLRNADGEIKRYCNRNFEITAEDIVEDKSGRGCNTINLKETPVVEITSIHDDIDREFGSGTLIDADDYAIENDTGIVYGDGIIFSRGVKNIRVSYRGGYGNDIANGETPIPKDLRESVLELASATFLRSQGRINAITGELLTYGENVSRAYKLADRYVRYDND